MFDGSLINYFPRPKDGIIASVDELAAAVAEWYAKNPGFQKNGDKILELMAQRRVGRLEGGRPATAFELSVLSKGVSAGPDARMGRDHG